MAIDSSIVTAGAAVMGSLVGGLASLGSSWFTQRYQGRRDYLTRQVTRRETLYAEFIGEAARLYSDALVTHLKQPEDMAKLWSMVARIRLSGSTAVVKEAESIMLMIGEQFLSENLTETQIHGTAGKEDPLKTFGEACRAELDAIDIDR